MADRSRPSDIDQLSDAMNNLQKSLQCTICLELMTEPTKTRCGHSFCKPCIAKVVQKKSATCPLCKKSLNRRNISKDDDLQTYIEKFKSLVIAIETDSHIDILSHSKRPRDTRESCSYPDATQSREDYNKEKPSKKKRSTRQSNQNADTQIDKPSTSCGAMIDCGNPQYNSNVSKPETSSSLFQAPAFFGGDDIQTTPDIKIRTWLHSFPDKPSTDDWIEGNEIPPIEDKAGPMNPISDDNGKSDEFDEVYRDEIDASRRPGRDRKSSTDCRIERIDESDTVSQVNKGARKNAVIEIDSAASGLKYNASHARIHAQESRGKNAKKSKSNSGKTVDQDSSSSMTASDQVHQIAASTSSGLNTTSATPISEQSTANWSRMIEFGKEMKRASKGKVKKLKVSTEKNKIPPRIIEDIKLSPNSRYDSSKIATSFEKEANASNRSASNDREQDATDKNLDLSDAKMKASGETNTRTKLFDKDKADWSKSTYPTMKTSYVMLEDGRQIGILNVNSNKARKIVDTVEDTQNCEKNASDCRDSPLSQQKRLIVLTPDKLNKSVHGHEIIRNAPQTPTDNFGSSSCLPAEKRTPGPRETSNVQGTSDGADSSQLQFLTPNKGRLSLRRKLGTDSNKKVNSPPLSQVSLAHRLSIGKHEEYIADRKTVDLPIRKDNERLKAVRRDLNFKMIHEDQQRADRDTVPASALKSIIKVEDQDENVSKIVRQDGKLGRNFTSESTMSKKFLSTKSKSAEYQGRRSPVKFTQLGSLVKRRNIRYFFLGNTRQELSMPAEVKVSLIYNMQQSSRSEVHVVQSPNPSNDSQDSNNITVMENTCFANNSNLNEAVSKESPATSLICKASATSTPKRDIDSHLNQRKSATIARSSANANQRSDKSIEDAEKVAKKDAQCLHGTSRADKSAIHRMISHIHPGTSKSIKLLSPDKDSQLKFLQIDSPMSEREQLRRVSSIKSVIKGNNSSEMESSRLAAFTLGEVHGPFIENVCKKRKRMKCASDRELFEDRSSDGNDCSSDSSRTTIERDKYNELSMKARSSRSDANKKRRLSSSNEVEAISSASEKQDTLKKKFNALSSDTKSESAAHVTENLKRHSDDQCAQRNASITDTATKTCSTTENLENDRIMNIIDKWSNEHNTTQKKLTKESKNGRNSVKSIRDPLEENPTSHQSFRSSNALKMEKHKSSKSSQKSSAKESNMFESSSLFNSENLDYIMQHPKADDTSKKIVDSSNDDIINRVLQIDRSRSLTDACQPAVSTPRNDITSEREKDHREYLLQDNFDEIIASVEQPQSEDFVPCSDQPDRNPNRSLAKPKTSNCCLAMTDESCGGMQDTPVVPLSSANDMFEHYSPRNVKKPETTTNAISRNSDKENVAYNQKRLDYVDDQGDRRDATANADAIDKDSRKTIVSERNVSRENVKLLEERDASIQSAGRLRMDDGDATRATTVHNESNSKEDDFEHDSLMNITQYNNRLKMFEEDLFGATESPTKAKKIISQNDPSQKNQHTPKNRKRNIRDKSMESRGRFADDDDVVENTPEKKMKNAGNNVKTIEARESTKIPFLSPISWLTERAGSTTPCQMEHPLLRSGASTPVNLFAMRPCSQSTPIIAHNSTVMNNRPNVFGGSKKIEHVKSGNILSTSRSSWKQADARTLENVRRQPDKRSLCLVCSGLSANQITTVKEFAAKYNTNYVNQFNRDVTHVIVKTAGEQNTAKSTLKYLQGIAHRKWIVSYRWIEDCNKQQKLLDEIPYEATTQSDVGINGTGPRNSRLRDKGLFEGFTFLCVEPYDIVSLSQYQDLLRACGALVVDSFEALAKVGGMKGVVIQDNSHEDKVIEQWYRTAKAAPILVDWIVECIGHYQLLKLEPYIQCLSPQDYCAIGYPQDLVEEEEYDSCVY